MKQHQKGNSFAMVNKGHVLPITISGASAKLDTKTLPKGSWMSCHGKDPVTGIEVQSLNISFYGDNAIIQDPVNGFEASFNATELGVMADQYNNLRKQAAAKLGIKLGATA